MSDSMISRFAQNTLPGSVISGTSDGTTARKLLGEDGTLSVVNYGAVDDGLEGRFLSTWTVNQNILTLSSITTPVTVQNTGTYQGSSVAVVTFPSLVSGNAGINIWSWARKPIAINGAGVYGGTFVAYVINVQPDYNNGNVLTLTLNRPAPTPLTASSQNILCPCFTTLNDGSNFPAALDKRIWIENGGSTSNGLGNPQMFTPICSTISRVITPFQVQLADNLTAPTRSAVSFSHIIWGTDNSIAVFDTAGPEAIRQNRSTLLFPGWTKDYSTGLFCNFDIWPQNGAVPTNANFLRSIVVSALLWKSRGKDTKVYNLSKVSGTDGPQSAGTFFDTGFKYTAVSEDAETVPQIHQNIKGAQHFPRCNTTNVITVVVTGDSWGVPNPSGTGGNDHYSMLAAVIERQNPGKTLHFVNRAISGATWQWLSSVPVSYPIAPNNWGTLPNPWLNYVLSVPAPWAGGGNITPDLVVIYMTGNNEAANSGAMYRNDIQAVINTIRAAPTLNGYPPDIMIVAGMTKGIEQYTSGAKEYYHLINEYTTSYLRSFARVWNIPFLDFSTIGSLVTDGWSSDKLTLTQVPSLASGTATATVPYTFPTQVRDFYAVIALGSAATTASAFWATAGTLSITLSAKGDNRLWIGPDASGNLAVCAVAWGLPVQSTVTTNIGSPTLLSNGQSALAVESRIRTPSPPGFGFSATSNNLPASFINQCMMIPSVMYNNEDYRSFITGQTSTAIAFAADGNGNAVNSTTINAGGMMFVTKDATAKADLIVGGAGGSSHILTGANSLITKVSAYTNYQTVTMLANATNNLAASSQKIFLGSITVPPTYDVAYNATTDVGNQACLTIQVRNNHVRVGVIVGGISLTNIRSATTREIIIWEGDVERFGGPYVPRIFCGASSTVQVLYFWAGEKEYKKQLMTHREFWGTGEVLFTYPYGGDLSHISQKALTGLLYEMIQAQDFSTAIVPLTTFGTNTPIAGFSYTIPTNQIFTKFTPAGVLATGTVILPSVFPQGVELVIMSTQTITALTVSAPTGFTIDGTAATTLNGGTSIRYILNGTVFTRVA